jgi:hypothetical protein
MKEVTIKSINPKSLALTWFIAYGLVGFIYNLLICMGEDKSLSYTLGYTAFSTFFCAIFGVIGGYLGAFFYNVAAKWCGGIKLEVE